MSNVNKIIHTVLFHHSFLEFMIFVMFSGKCTARTVGIRGTHYRG